MLDFPGFCYLDVEKTGSTFIRAFLVSHAKTAPRDDTKHRVPRLAFRWRKFYFASARDPFDSYASLWSYGCDGGGVVRGHLARTGSELLSAYDRRPDGFIRWLDAMLGEDRARYLPPSALGYHSPHLGLMGVRFLRQTLPGARRRLPGASGAGDIGRAYARFGLPRAVIRQESLAADLSALIAGPLRRHMRDPQAALAELAAAPPAINASDRTVPLSPAMLPDALCARLEALEWFHYDMLGYPRPR
ncbi:hypothetical protein HMH01_00560 [Halovulum dunhuangense]|uniref:Sulfotransferase family protein n=1 Tax=Halovulum dunhuangense TaxID=1505036 RepID=A0A849KY51_9RHOB|nr:hypothetical protein [Halovulum dunhuangense]NNU78916.1 hypothetical protein [Halovulum dunhuangense]